MISLKTVMGVVQAVPALSSLVKNTIKQGRIDPNMTLNVLTGLSPDFKNCADRAINVVNNGGSIADALSEVMDYGEVSLPIGNKKINTRNVVNDLRKMNTPWSIVVSNMLDMLPKQSPGSIVSWADKASDVNAWFDQ